MLPGKQAIVIGGGIAGLLATRVLTEHFEHVLLIERDHYPEEPVFRAGVPQGRHIHIMKLRGQHTIEELFPGITKKLIARGAIEIDFIREFAIRYPAGWLPRLDSSLKGYTYTRLLLEWQIRRELIKNERVQVIEGREVVGLVASNDGLSVKGVRIRTRNGTAPTEGEQEEMLADLVVDASGRESHTPTWLEEMGYMPPEETVINAFLGYATCTYEPAPDLTRDWKGLRVASDPPKNLRGGIIWPIEGGRWMVLLGGSGKDYPPTDESGFLEFARSMLDTALYDAIKEATPVTPIYGYRWTENRWRHFERLQQQPERFVVIGDAFCVFNPIYGQGMTVAALEAMALHESLRQQRDGLEGLAMDFHKRQAIVTRLPWQQATAQDARVLQAKGEGRKVPLATKVMNGYLQGLSEVLPSSPLAYRTFIEVQHMVKPPAALFQPAVVWKVLTRKPA